MTIPTTDYYFEGRVTIDPVDDETELREIAKRWGFRVADLLMKKSLAKSRLDAFMTARSLSYQDIGTRTNCCVQDLAEAGFVVRRYKIENTLLDVRPREVESQP